MLKSGLTRQDGIVAVINRYRPLTTEAAPHRARAGLSK